MGSVWREDDMHAFDADWLLWPQPAHTADTRHWPQNFVRTDEEPKANKRRSNAVSTTTSTTWGNSECHAHFANDNQHQHTAHTMNRQSILYKLQVSLGVDIDDASSGTFERLFFPRQFSTIVEMMNDNVRHPGVVCGIWAWQTVNGCVRQCCRARNNLT